MRQPRPPQGPSWFTVLFSLAMTGLILAAWWYTRDARRPELEPDAVRPPGHWTRVAPRPRSSPPAEAEPGTHGEGLAQLLSLPYSSGTAPAPDQRGVVHHDRLRAQPGFNLYVSGHAPEVILIDMDGRFLHRWRRSYEEIFTRPPGPETDFIRRARLLRDGSLLVLFQGGGLARLDARSDVIWATPGAFFNDFDLVGDRVYVVGKTAAHADGRIVRALPSLSADEPFLKDFIAVVDLASGDRLEQAPLLDAFDRGGLLQLLEPLPDTPDIFHTNTVTVLEAPAPAALERTGDAPIFGAGNLLISLREVDVVAVLDASLQTVLWARRGPWKAQHEPVLLDHDQLLVFDNRGGPDGRSRVLIWDLERESISWTFEHPTFYTRQAGVAARLENGNILITSSEQGRAFEIDGQGQVVWEWVSPHRAGRQNELVATLFEVQRLPLEAASWLDG